MQEEQLQVYKMIKDGKPAWIVSGLWRGSLTNMTSAAMMSFMKCKQYNNNKQKQSTYCNI
jgi:hypothetical protein